MHIVWFTPDCYTMLEKYYKLLQNVWLKSYLKFLNVYNITTYDSSLLCVECDYSI